MTDAFPPPDASALASGETRGPRSRWRIVGYVLAALVVLAVLAVYSGICLYRAAQSGARAKTALLQAEQSLRAQDVVGARQHLSDARRELSSVDHSLGLLGPLRAIGHVTPVVRVQLHGVEAYSDAGKDLVDGASRLTDAIDQLLHPTGGGSTISRSVEPLRNLDHALQDSVDALDRAADHIEALNGYRLLGPLNNARAELLQRLPKAIEQAHDAARGVDAVLTFVGANGPKRFLVFAQNPDEVRPTGGFIGSYGILATDGTTVDLERFDDIQHWIDAHPAKVSPDEEATAFRILESGQQQSLANVNAGIDWVVGAQQALELWQRSGETPVDGAVLITPELLRRVLTIIGPVPVPDYGETVSSDNLIDRLDFYTHEQAASERPAGGRKLFLSAVAEATMHILLDAPTKQWQKLGEQMVAGFDLHEAMAWSAEPSLATVIGERAWDGRIPQGPGDFLADAPFEYAAKNGRGLIRAYDHSVKIEPDGSGVVTTTVTIRNTLPPDDRGKLNLQALFYDIFYGPSDSTIDSSADPPFIDDESSVGGHPAASYVINAPPLGQASVKVAFRVPKLLVAAGTGHWRYSLFWRHLPTTTADTLNLSVELPPGWRWTNGGPPTNRRLTEDLLGEWDLSSP